MLNRLCNLYNVPGTASFPNVHPVVHFLREIFFEIREKVARLFSFFNENHKNIIIYNK